ncbi:hypothetical protein L7F22_008866 [Adiantum nelumboides]|nr:hypothetical protein [Adiantum nelumboides]
MAELHSQTQDAIARAHNQPPLFLHIFRNVQQFKQYGRTAPLQTSCEELSAPHRLQRMSTANLNFDPRHASVDGLSTFSKDGFYLRSDVPLDPPFNDTIVHVSNLALDIETATFERGRSHSMLLEAKDQKTSVPDGGFSSLTQMEATDGFSGDRFIAPSSVAQDFNLLAYPAGVVTMDGGIEKVGTQNAIPHSHSIEEIKSFDPRNEEVTKSISVTNSTCYSSEGERLDGSTQFVPEMVTGGYKGGKLMPEGVRGGQHRLATMYGTHDDCAGSLSEGDAAIEPLGRSSLGRSCDFTNGVQGANFVAKFVQTEEVTCDTCPTFERNDIIGAHTAEEVLSLVAHVPTPPTAEQPASLGDWHAHVNDAASNAENGSLSYKQRWRRHFKGVSSSWQDRWQLQEETNHEHKDRSIPEFNYSDVIGAVISVAKCLPKNETLQEHLQPFAGRIDDLCGNAILYKLQKERLFLCALSFFDWMRLQTPCLLNSRSLCTMFTILGDAKMVDKALVLYDNLKHWKELWRVQVFNALLSALSKHSRYDEALAVFQEMSRMKIQPDGVTFCIMLNLAHKSGSKVELLWQIFVDIENQNVFAGHEVFGVLIKAFCQEGRRDEALRLLSMMEGRGLIPNIIIYNTLIGAFGKVGMLEEAEGLLSEMKGKGISMTVVTYNILIDSYASLQKFEVAEGILQGMLEKGPQPNVVSFTALIAAYGRNFLSEKAASVFLRMRKHGVFPNTVAYTALIHAYAEDGWHTKAEFAFENMIREGCRPTVETYTSLLHAFRQAGDLEKVKSIWKRMRLEVNIGTRETFNVLMDACAKQGDYAEARNVMYEFKKIGYESDTKTYNMLIYAYTRGGQHSKAPEILLEMQKAGCSPDSFTYTTLIYSFLRVRDFTQAFEYHDKMCRSSQRPDKFTYQKLRALLDEKYEIKAERNMHANIGAQREEHDVEKEKKLKSFMKKEQHFSSPVHSRVMHKHNI